MQTVSVIGMGRMGNAIARNIDLPFSVIKKYARSQDIAKGISPLSDQSIIDSDLIIITTNDDSIAEVAYSLRDKIVGKPDVLHTSGSLSSSVLGDLRHIGCSVASLHPLVSVSDDSSMGVFDGVYFCIEGDEKAVVTAASLARSLGGESFTISTDAKPLYHAAAVMAAGHIVALVDMADELMKLAGINEEMRLEILQPLVSSVVSNIFSKGTSKSLTGTYARGDLGTARQHLEALETNADRGIFEVFIGLALRSVAIARRNEGNANKRDELESFLNLAKQGGEL